MTEKKICVYCGAEIDKEALICPSCGVLQQDKVVPTTSIKNEGLAAVLSFFFLGLGQIYNGQILKGFIFIIIEFIVFLLTPVIMSLWQVTWWTAWTMLMLFCLPIYLYGIYDAYDVAKKINEGIVV